MANEQVTVTIDPCGGTFSPTTFKVTKGVGIELLMSFDTFVDKKTVTITFDANYEGAGESVKKNNQTSLLGFYTERNGGGEKVDIENVYLPTSDVTLYALWEDIYPTPATRPKRDGATFNGWYYADGSEVYSYWYDDPGVPFHEDTTVYAHWLPSTSNRFFVGTKSPKFYVGTELIKQIYKGITLIYDTPVSKISYNNINGFKAVVPSGGTSNTYTLPAASLENAEGTITYSLYSDAKCTTAIGTGITYDASSRKITVSNSANETVAVQDTNKDGLATFYVKAACGELSIVKEFTVENHKVHVKFYERYTEKSLGEGDVYYGTSAAEVGAKYEEEAKKLIAAMEPDKYSHNGFDGWRVSESDDKSTYEAVKGDTTFESRAVSIPHTYDEGTGEINCEAESKIVYHCTGCSYSYTETYPAGHKIDENSEGYAVTKTATCTEAGSAKGVCEKCGKQVTVELHALGHEIVVDVYEQAATCVADGHTEGKHCTREGCNYKVESTTIRATGHSLKNNSNICEKCGKYNYYIIYSSNTGDIVTDMPIYIGSKYSGESTNISSIQPKREGYTFKGWGTSDASTIASYNPGDVYSSDSNLTLYAIWSEDDTSFEKTITLNLDEKRCRDVSKNLVVYYKFTPPAAGRYNIAISPKVYNYSSNQQHKIQVFSSDDNRLMFTSGKIYNYTESTNFVNTQAVYIKITSEILNEAYYITVSKNKDDT